MQVRAARINEGLSLKCELDHTVKNIAYILGIQFPRSEPQVLRCVCGGLSVRSSTGWGASDD
jgi:hypothetical protein